MRVLPLSVGVPRPALARKAGPQVSEALLGLREVSETLLNSIVTKRAGKTA